MVVGCEAQSALILNQAWTKHISFHDTEIRTNKHYASNDPVCLWSVGFEINTRKLPKDAIFFCKDSARRSLLLAEYNWGPYMYVLPFCLKSQRSKQRHSEISLSMEAGQIPNLVAFYIVIFNIDIVRYFVKCHLYCIQNWPPSTKCPIESKYLVPVSDNKVSVSISAIFRLGKCSCLSSLEEHPLGDTFSWH